MFKFCRLFDKIKNVGTKPNKYFGGTNDTFLTRLNTKHYIAKVYKNCIKYKKPCMIYTSYYDYHDKMMQRPQHFFNNLSRKGYPVVCCTLQDKFSIFNDNLFVVPFRQLPYFIHDSNFEKFFVIPYNFPYHDAHLLKMSNAINDNTVVIYELIDDFDLLPDKNTINDAKKMFKQLIQRKNTFVFASASKLYQKALNMGCPSNKLIVSKNGVNIKDFKHKQNINKKMNSIVEKHKPIIGYYGAISDWFDFDLLKKIIQKKTQWEFVVIGPENKNINQLSKFDNFTYIPTVPYKEIPSYAKCWDVATIPFKINDITLGVSPVKLFEYMAMGLPIVTTPMPECKLYKSVFIAKDADEFEKQIAKAIKAKSDKKYQETLSKEASENTWEARVNDMIKIIEKHYKE